MADVLRVRCNKSDAAGTCAACPHNGEHDEVIYPGFQMAPGAYRSCSEGGSCRCVAVAVDPGGQKKLF